MRRARVCPGLVPARAITRMRRARVCPGLVPALSAALNRLLRPPLSVPVVPVLAVRARAARVPVVRVLTLA